MTFRTVGAARPATFSKDATFSKGATFSEDAGWAGLTAPSDIVARRRPEPFLPGMAHALGWWRRSALQVWTLRGFSQAAPETVEHLLELSGNLHLADAEFQGHLPLRQLLDKT